MLDEQRVERDPVPLGHALPQRHLRLLGGPGAHDPEPVRDPMAVRVHRDRGDPVPEDQHAVRGLRPNAAQRGEFLEGAGDDPREPVEQLCRALAHDAGLDAIEPCRPDQRLELGGVRTRERGGVGTPGKQPRARDVGVRVPGPLGQDRSDQDLERVLGVVPEVRPPPVPRTVEGAEPVEDRLPVDRRGPGLGGHSRLRGAGARPVDAAGGDATPGSERSGSSGSVCRSSPIR